MAGADQPGHDAKRLGACLCLAMQGDCRSAGRQRYDLDAEETDPAREARAERFHDGLLDGKSPGPTSAPIAAALRAAACAERACQDADTPGVGVTLIKTKH